MKEKIKSKKIVPIIVIIGVIILPLLYSYFYLGAFWDPYSRLESVPVAIVNEDNGTTINNEKRNIGQEVCDKLKEDGALKFTFTDAKTAKEGTEGKKYYATIKIPSNFSENIASASESKKQVAEITYTSNEKRNYLASQILNSAVARIEKSVRSSVNKEIVGQLTDKLESSPEQLTTLADGLGQLHDGSSALQDGTSTLKGKVPELQSGASKLVDGTSQLKNGTYALKAGTTDLSKGTSQLVNGSTELANGNKAFNDKFSAYKAGVDGTTKGSEELSTNMKNLDSGIQALIDGATKLETKTKDLGTLKLGALGISKGASDLNTNLVEYNSDLNAYISSIKETTKTLEDMAQKTGDPNLIAEVQKLNSKEISDKTAELSNDYKGLMINSQTVSAIASKLVGGTANIDQLNPGISELKAGLQKSKAGSLALSNGAAKLNSGMNQLSTATSQLGSASKQLSDGSSTLNGGLLSLQDGITKTDNGVAALSSGATQVADGTSALKAGTDALVKGTSDLDDGALKLKDGIGTAKDGVNDSITDINGQLKVLNGLDEYAENPVQINTEAYSPVANYGTSFAPYFMSLSLWVGGLMIFFGIYFDPDGKFKLLSRESDNKALRSFAYLGIAFLQAIILDFVLLVCLGLKVNHMGMFLVSTVLVSMVFISIIQLMIVFLKDIGKFLSLVFLILQLTSCGGTFPMETVPKIFNILYPFMPMTYSVGIFKEAISSIDGTSLAWQNFGILMGILVAAMAITLIFSRAKKIKADGVVEA